MGLMFAVCCVVEEERMGELFDRRRAKISSH